MKLQQVQVYLQLTLAFQQLCTAESSTSVIDQIKSVADISSDDTEVTCAGAGSVKVTGKGQFANQPAATITCTNGNCSTTFAGK